MTFNSGFFLGEETSADNSARSKSLVNNEHWMNPDIETNLGIIGK